MLNQMVEYQRSALDATYLAIAHPIRREMMARLRHGDGRVTDVAADFDVSLAAASKHIRVLESAGLVRRTIEGRVHRLALETGPMAEAAAWIEGYRAFWEQRLDALEQMLADPQPDA